MQHFMPVQRVCSHIRQHARGVKFLNPVLVFAFDFRIVKLWKQHQSNGVLKGGNPDYTKATRAYLPMERMTFTVSTLTVQT